MTIPLEDNFEDIIGKAQRGFNLTDDLLARKAGVELSELSRVQAGQVAVVDFRTGRLPEFYAPVP